MPLLDLDPPNWSTLVGGTKEADWLADRNRKFGLGAALMGHAIEVADVLEVDDGLFRCSAAALKAHAFAGDWYVSLAGFSMKTLQNVKLAPATFGLTLRAKTVVEALRKGRDVSDENLVAFSDWINSELAELFPREARTREIAVASVALILGGRTIGRGQNQGGDDAVTLLKSLLVQGFEQRGHRVELRLEDDTWARYKPEHNLPVRSHFRVAGQLLFELVSGGDRPDIVIMLGPVTVAVGEVKGRKDLANVWESWMPGVYNHMRTWTAENPDAARIFFGTLINQPMVDGASTHGTKHVGLKTLHKQGLLTTAFNISKVAENEMSAVREFDAFVARLTALL